jgi:putative toxin-antitoxin system antitoxin component (TIGR02293 family)
MSQNPMAHISATSSAPNSTQTPRAKSTARGVQKVARLPAQSQAKPLVRGSKRQGTYSTVASAPWFDRVEQGLASSVDVHSELMKGLSGNRARVFLGSFGTVPKAAVFAAIGISQRTLDRAIEQKKLLGRDATDRATRLAEARAKAKVVFGDFTAAEKWLLEPSSSLGGERPIDLLQTSTGTEMVKTYLMRIDRGVYA